MEAKLTFFMTASGILVAILLVWAQLWITTAQEYSKVGHSTLTVGVSLAWVYGAILTSMLAFATMLIQYSVSRFALFLLILSVILTGILIAGSLYASVTSTIAGLDILAPSYELLPFSQ